MLLAGVTQAFAFPQHRLLEAMKQCAKQIRGWNLAFKIALKGLINFSTCCASVHGWCSAIKYTLSRHIWTGRSDLWINFHLTFWLLMLLHVGIIISMREIWILKCLSCFAPDIWHLCNICCDLWEGKCKMPQENNSSGSSYYSYSLYPQQIMHLWWNRNAL